MAKKKLVSPKQASRETVMEALKQIVAGVKYFKLHPNGVCLDDYRVHSADRDISFQLFSDRTLVRVKYVDTVKVPISRQRVVSYRLEPQVGTNWFGVCEISDDERNYKLFMRSGDKFVSMQPPEGTIGDLMRKF